MYLLTTDTLVELRESPNRKRDRRLAVWAASIDQEDVYISAISLQEIEIGIIEVERDGVEKAAGQRSWLNEQLLRHFQGRILPIDAEVALLSARLHAHQGRSVVDAICAATAQRHGLSVVTRWPDNFRSAGVRVINPWQP